MTKTKSRHHKSENQYRFLTLAERLANIKTDVSKRINRIDDKPLDETETYFFKSVEKWCELNYTADFSEFSNSMRHNCQTLAQLIYHKDEIIDKLIEFISKGNPLSLQPLLDLTIQLSRDLQVDFYQYFPKFFHTIVGLLDTQDTEILEWSFQCLSYLFKYLWRYMLKDLENVYNLYSPLFDESRKVYIRNFAAESFAFLMRKIVDKNELFTFLLKRLKEHSEECYGTGQLIFEMFKGVQRQFNMCTEESLKVLFDKLDSFDGDQELNELTFKCISQTITSMSEYTAKEHSNVVWNCFCSAISKNSGNKAKLCSLLMLLQTFIGYHNGYLVNSVDLLVNKLIELTKLDVNDDSSDSQLTKQLFSTSKLLILSEQVKFSIDKIRSFIDKLYSLCRLEQLYQSKYDFECVVELTKGLFEYDMFEELILPNLLNYIDKNMKSGSNNQEFIYENGLFDLLADYLTFKQLISIDSSEFSEVEQTSQWLNSICKSKNMQQFLRVIQERQRVLANLHANMKDFIGYHLKKTEKLNDCDLKVLNKVLILSPFVLKLSKNEYEQLIEQLVANLLSYLSELGNKLTDKDHEFYCFTLSISIWSLIMLNKSICTNGDANQKLLFDLLLKINYKNEHKCVLHILRSMDFVIEYNKKLKETDLNESLFDILKSQLSAPYHQIRLLSLNTLSKLTKDVSQKGEEKTENVLEICLQAEKTAVTLEDYRQKLYYLQKLEFSISRNLIPSKAYEDVPLKYFFGVLYENFQLIWDPVVKLIKSYADNMPVNEFWSIFSSHLEHVVKIIEVGYSKETDKNELIDNIDYLRDCTNVDHLNNRHLLLLSMQEFSQLCETKTKFVVPLLFRFMENEYYKNDNRLSTNSFEDIRKKNETKCVTVEDEDLVTTNDGELEIKETPKAKYNNKVILSKHLCAFLDVFSKFTSPKSWYQEEKLRNLFLNLLRHFDAKVQKSALQCLFVYNYNYLMPYKDHLLKMLEGKHFRHEIVVFSLEEQNGVVSKEHREQLLPIIMRLLYGKFHSHDSTHTSSRGDKVSTKRTTIIQFLSSCAENEIQLFFNLIFDCLLGHLNKKNEIIEVNYEHVIPLKKILGILQTLQIVIDKLGKNMKLGAHRILEMLCFVSKYTANILINNKNNVIDPYYLNLLRIIRQNTASRFKEFFESYDDLDYSEDELSYLFDSFIWFQLPKLATECLFSVNNLMKLFLLWSERSRFYPLLVIKPSNFKNNAIFKCDNDKSILDYIFELINIEKCSSTVVDFVMNIVYNLVTYSDFKDVEVDEENPIEVKSLPVQVNVDMTYDQGITDELNFGTIILKPYSKTITSHIELIVIKHMSSKQLPPKPLKILAQMSCFALDSKQQSEKIISLFIPYLVKNRKQNEENEVNILNSINHLLKQVSSVANFVCPLSQLFAVLINRTSRTELCNVFKTIKSLDSTLTSTCDIAIDLNAWDPKRLEEPDFMIRLDAYKRMNTTVREWSEFDDKLGLVLLYNCCYVLNNLDDLALKESSTHSLLELMRVSSKLNLSHSAKNIFEANLISQIKIGLRNKKSEPARHEFTNILINFIRIFEKIFPKFNDLLSLTDEDIEKDFYENIVHIQMHRRSRALKRLQRICNEKKISTDNLLGFMMPIIKSFIDNEMYHKYDYLIDEATNAIGAVCYCLSWQKYYKVLDFYLKIMPKNIINTKIVIKVIVSVLEAFHYDLSQSTAFDRFSEKLDEELEEAKVENEEESEDDDDKPDEIAVNGVAGHKLTNGNHKMEINGQTTTTEESKDQEHSINLRIKQVINPETATKIHIIVTKTILPLLFKYLTKRTKSDEEHKVNKKVTERDETEQILRVPIALAILKLLINLPKRSLETYLPGLLLRVCEMLKSRLFSVRQSTRECLIKFVNTLDKRYYYFIFKELSDSLTKGYQVHVLCFTVQVLLKQMQPKLVIGDLDSSISILAKLFNSELFSQVSEEKDVKQIVSKVNEAKFTSSYNSYEFVAKYVTQSFLLELIKPLCEQLDACKSRKIIKKIEEALRRTMIGLLDNKGLRSKELLLFIYGLINDSFENIASTRKKFYERQKMLEQQNTSALQSESSLIIRKEPTRGGEKPKAEPKTNQHVLIEFALLILYNLLKQNRLVPSEVEHLQMLDPYIQYFIDYLDGKYIKVTIAALRCLNHLFKFKLPSFKTHGTTLATKLFKLLRTYGGTNDLNDSISIGGDNFDLLIALFKAISTMLRDCQDFFDVENEHLQVLLHHAERNLHDNSRQASAFNLLKAILSRKLQCDELDDVISKIMKMSIQSESSNVRLQSRQTILQYLIDYPLNAKKLQKYLEFYIMQLNYEYEDGRESALEMLATIFASFPLKQLNEYATLFFVPLAVRLNNDDSAKCKKLTSLAIKSLIEKISIEQRDALFEITKAWFNDTEKLAHNRIGTLLIKLFVDCEKEQFERRLSDIIPILIQQLDKRNIEADARIDESERFHDQYLVNLLNLIIKLLNECKIMNTKQWDDYVNQLFDKIKQYLIHEHTWVQLASTQLFGILFSNTSIDDLINNKTSYLNCSNDPTFIRIRDLIDGFVEQLKSPILDDNLAQHVIKNLVYMAKLLKKYPFKKDEDETIASSNKKTVLKHDMNLSWLIKKVIKEANYELVRNNKQTIKRSYIFKWLGAVALELGKEDIKDYLAIILPPLQREVVVSESDHDLKKLAQDVLDLLKQTIGVEDFSDVYSKSNKKRSEVKEERKRKSAQMAINEPQKAAMKKIRRMQKKKQAKKRKINEKSTKNIKKRKKIDNNFFND